jgi:hypothetical protein
MNLLLLFVLVNDLIDHVGGVLKCFVEFVQLLASVRQHDAERSPPGSFYLVSRTIDRLTPTSITAGFIKCEPLNRVPNTRVLLGALRRPSRIACQLDAVQK